MKVLSNLLHFIQHESGELLQQTLVHSGLTFLSLCLAILISVPLGIYITRHEKWAKPVLGAAGILQTIPSIALLGFMIPLLGIGVKPAIVALFLYAILPIIRNTYTGIQEVDTDVKEAAKAMGMTTWQILRKVELPLAFPVILAGIRTATVINVGVATLAAYIGSGGLGEFIFGGIALNNSAMILAGAIPAALLALLFDFLLSRLEHLQIKKLKNTMRLTALGFLFISSLFFVPKVFGSALTFGFAPEFMGRPDGYPGLKRTYNLQLNTLIINEAMLYKAIEDNQIDVMSGYSTDGRVKANHLKILKDDKQAFPPYYAAAVVKASTLKKYPQLLPALNKLQGQIDDSTMSALNFKVDDLKESPQKVAKDFLKQKQLFKPSNHGHKGSLIIGSKIFSEQYILAYMYQYLIEGYTQLAVDTKTGLGGTKICFDALRHGQIDLYPEYTGTALQAILHISQKKIDSLITSRKVTYHFIQKKFKEKYGLRWLQPIGFNNTYALMMRKKRAKKLKIQSISDLKNYLSQH